MKRKVKVTVGKYPEILLHPNIPKPLHGLNPRTVMGAAWWDEMRFKAYEKYDNHCWACGVHRSQAHGRPGILEAHEIYSIDYVKGRMELMEISALCSWCHSYIHDGLLNVLLEDGQVTQKQYDRIMAHGAAVLKAAGCTMLKPLYPEESACAEWGKWHLVIKGKKFFTRFKDYDDWLENYRGST